MDFIPAVKIEGGAYAPFSKDLTKRIKIKFTQIQIYVILSLSDVTFKLVKDSNYEL